MKIYRAIIIQGFLHGGGDYVGGPWRATFDEADEDLKDPRLKPHYGDAWSGVTVVASEEDLATLNQHISW